MRKNFITNNDRMLQIVLHDSELIKHGEYNPDDFETIEDALDSDNAVVHAVATIINGKQTNNRKEIYNNVSNYLKTNLV